MIDDDERRAAAERLRHFLSEPWDERSWYHDSLQNVGSLIGTSVGENIIQRLADLIDRPTAKREHNGAYWRCSHCGAFTRKDAVIIDGLDVVPLRHCGNCGREWDYD